MKKETRFTKISAAGNDFIVIDNRTAKIKSNLKKFSKKVCVRKTGVGADGLILIESSRRADFKMRIFNADGSEAEMCGNGARACAFYAYENEIGGGKMSFETIAGIVEARVIKDGVSIKMVNPSRMKKGVKINHNNKDYDFNCIDSGVPHAVSFCRDVNSVDIAIMGPHVRFYKEFQPSGTNVNFARVVDKHNLELRTYERGVEAETLACGTGATATAVLAAEIHGCLSPVNVKVRSGDSLTISFKKNKDGNFENVYMKGPAKVIYKGILNNYK